jgi:hypothetical protein
MGTRGAIGFIVNGEEKVSYNHMDSYPSYLGKNLLKDLTTISDLNILHENVRRISMVDAGDVPELSSEEISSLKEFTNNSVGQGDDWYSILRESQGSIEPYCRQENPLRYMTDAKGFLYDSLFCEFAYIVNLDTNMVEFYRGFNHHLDAPGRYACPPALKEDLNAVATRTSSRDYCGVALVGEAPIEAFMQVTDEQIDRFIEKLEEFMSNFDYENSKTLQIEDNS